MVLFNYWKATFYIEVSLLFQSTEPDSSSASAIDYTTSMKKFIKTLSNYKFTLLYIFLALILPCAVMYFSPNTQPEFIVSVNILINIILFVVLGPQVELKRLKLLTLFIVSILSILAPFILIFAYLFSPAQKRHDLVMYEICMPAMRKQYNIKGGEAFPSTTPDKDGWEKWWFQHTECENNVYDGKGPIFSENPPGYHPAK